MEYEELADIFAELEETSKTLDKTAILAELFENLETGTLRQIVKLVRGKLFANWESGDVGMSTALTSKAISKATGITEKQVETWWREEGDLGDAAFLAVQNNRQQTLYSQSLTVETVFTTLRELGEYEGEGSQERRVNTLAGLLSDASPREAKYIVRIARCTLSRLVHTYRLAFTTDRNSHFH